jgi:hypothetical protein
MSEVCKARIVRSPSRQARAILDNGLLLGERRLRPIKPQLILAIRIGNDSKESWLNLNSIYIRPIAQVRVARSIA